MPYTSLDDLTDRYGQAMLVAVTDRGELATGQIDSGVVDRALADADAEIDGYLKARYALPLAEVPPLVRDIAMAVTIWKLHTFMPDQKIEADYKDAVRKLKELSAGTLRLDVAGVEPESSGSDGVRVTDRERPFTEDNMKGYI